jgi:hypothetical protein
MFGNAKGQDGAVFAPHFFYPSLLHTRKIELLVVTDEHKCGNVEG